MTRRIVLPTIRIVVLAVIAAALVRLAFGGDDDEPSGGPATPSLDIVQPEVQVALGTVTNLVEVDATISADAPTRVRATDGGKVNTFLADPGETVATDDPLVEVVFEEAADPPAAAAGEEGESAGQPAEQPAEPRRRFRTIKAPVAGTVGEYQVLRGQEVSIGDEIGSIATGGFTVSGSLSAEQQYRLISPPTAAEIQPVGGPAPFVCANLRIGQQAAVGESTDGENAAGGNSQAAPPNPLAGADGSGGGGSGGGGGSSTEISCTVPEGITVFDGLNAVMSIQAGTAENVPLVPVTAVQGSFQSGNVWVVGETGEPEKRAVGLGITDGEMVQITEGLTEGETVLQFVPSEDEESLEDEMSGEFVR